MNKFFALTFFATSCLVVACGAKATDAGLGQSPDVNTSDDGDDNESSASQSQHSEMEQTLYAPVSSSDPTAAASSVAAAQWWPAGCATRSKDATNPDVVHITLDDCTGPFGLVHHSGNITVVFSKNAAGGLHAEASSTDMTVNGKPVTFSSSRDIAIAGTTISITGNGAWTRVDDAGETVSLTTNIDASIDVASKCRTGNGSAVTMIGAREIDSKLDAYQVCLLPDGADACPSGSITNDHKVTGRVVTVSFDGSDEATITGPKGGTIQVPLVCGS